eukprot:9731393-Prorocentrum_lima.AAC.1
MKTVLMYYDRVAVRASVAALGEQASRREQAEDPGPPEATGWREEPLRGTRRQELAQGQGRSGRGKGKGPWRR